MLSRPLHLSPTSDLDSLKSASTNSHSSGSNRSRSSSQQRSSPQPLPPNSRNLSFPTASFPYSSLHQQQQQQQPSPYMHKQEKMFRGRLDLPPEENADLEELEKFAKMFKQKRIKLGMWKFITYF
jgi:Pou domain - N-terminal to homeobox domain